MTTAEFNRLIEQPSLVKDVDMAELRDLVSRYPYCSSAHLLLAKKYQVDKHSDFDSKLSLTAAYANDRKSLYRLLYDESKFKTVDRHEEASAVGTHEQRIGTEILLGNESGAFSDYTPKNQVAEIETYESMDFIKTGWAEGLRSMEDENTDQLADELQEQFTLASEKAGGGAEIVHDFDNLEEENDDELLDEKTEVELESTKVLEGAIENAVEENEYRESASISNSSAELTHDFDGLAEENENELLEENLDVELESTKALENAIEHNVVEPDYDRLATTASQNGINRHESETISSPIQEPESAEVENVEYPQVIDKQSSTEYNKDFEPSKGLADLLGDTESESEDIGVEYVEESVDTHQAVESFSSEEDYQSEATLQEILEEANLPTSLDEHEIKPEALVNETVDEEFTATNLTTDLTPRQEIDAPMAQEDLVGTEHHKITSETESAYRTDEPKIETPSVIHQGVELEGSRTFTDWLKLFKTTSDKPTHDSRLKTQDRAKPGDAEVLQQPVKESKKPEIEDDNELYDREWKARKLEMESWTAGLPDELKVIDEFVAQHSTDKPEHQNISVAELAERSLILNDEFLTETMAKVYASQGKYKKAAEVIEKLMLKNPAKKLYFADLLEEFKKKITS